MLNNLNEGFALNILKYLNFRSLTLFAFVLLGATACNTLSGAGSDNAQKPADLKPIVASKQFIVQWSHRLEDSDKMQASTILPTISDGVLYTADKKYLTAVEVKTGQRLWQQKLETTPTSSPAVQGGKLVIALSNSHLNAYSLDKRNLLWSQELPNLVLAKPALSRNKIVIKTIDDEVIVLDENGQTLWHDFHTAPDLTVQGASAPVVMQEQVLVGFSDSVLNLYDLNSGQVVWSVQVAEPTGTFPVQRLVDIVATPLVDADRIFTVTYQGKIAALTRYQGSVIWERPLSSVTGVCISQNKVFTTDNQGEVWAFNKNNGEVLFHQTDLQYRNLTAPLCLEAGIVVGDSEGYLHLLSKEDGHLLGRLSVGKGAFKTHFQKISSDSFLVTTTKGNVILVRLAS
jgi:outer membrane protein assembly factor BamB